MKVDEVVSKIDSFKTVSILRNLIKIPSYIGEEAEKAEYVTREMERRGLEVSETILETPRRRSVLGTLRGVGTGRSLMLCAHLDTLVPNPTIPNPHEAVMKDGKIYGIGLGDGSNSPMAAIFGAIDAVKRANIPLKGDLIFLASADQLGHKQGVQVVEENGIKVDICVVGEPSNLDIGVVHTGKVELEIRTRGMAPLMIAAAAERHKIKVVNAVVSMNKVITYLHKMVEEEPYFHQKHPMLPGEGAAFYVGPIMGGSWGYGDPTRPPGTKAGQHGLASPAPTWCKLRIGCRYWPGQTSKEFVDLVKKWIGKARAEDPSIEAEVEVYLDGLNEPFEISPEDEIVQILRRSIRRALKREPKLTGMVGSTECPFYKRLGMQVAFCGPTMLRFGALDEHITVEELIDACKVYAAVILDVCT